MKVADVWLKNLRTLHLPRHATWSEVQTAYRQLVLAHHPDVNPSRSATERFRQVTAAYEELVYLRREREARSEASWRQFRDDPQAMGLPADELALRMRHSTSPRMRSAAVYLLGQKGGEECRQLLRQEGRGERDESVQRAILEALGLVGRPGDLWRFAPLLLSGASGLRLLDAFCHASASIWRRALKAVVLAVRPCFLAGRGKEMVVSG